MNKKILFLLFSSFLLFATTLFAQEDSLYVEILNEPFEVSVGDTAYVEAVYVDSNKVEHDTTFAWSVSPTQLGSIDSTGQFVAADTGRGYIYAEFNGLIDSVVVEIVNEDEDDDGDDGEYPYLVITPDEKELTVGETFQFSALYVAAENDERDTTVSWQVMHDSVATVDSTGLVTALKEGRTPLKAFLDTLSATAIVEVEDSVDDDDDGDQYPFLLIVPEEAELKVGETFAFQAYYVAGHEDKRDTTVTWTVTNDSLASIDSTGLLSALQPGELNVIATLDSLTANAEVEIEDSTDDDGGGGEDGDHHNIVVKPKEATVYVGSTLQFTAHYDDEDSSEVADSNFTWSLEGMPVGTIDQNGLFTADSVGFTLVYAHLDEETYGTAFVLVIDSTSEAADLNTITITKSKNKGNGNGNGNDYKVIKTLQEGDVWKLGGLPHPMNFLNGGRIYFPIGSLKEDIRIHMNIPDFDEEDNDSTDFGAPGVVSAVDFQVFVGDTLVEPYYFETPLIVGLVYKKGLLEQLNIDPYTVALYFTYNSADSVHFDSSGIAYTTVDPHRNRIYSTVAHFSTLSAKGKENSVITSDKNAEEVPNNFELYQNYPNPFNPSTTIKYYLPQTTKVKVIVYDILGKQIATLVNKEQTAGYKSVIWNGINSSGSQVSSGIYFYQLQANDLVQTRKMMLIK